MTQNSNQTPPPPPPPPEFNPYSAPKADMTAPLFQAEQSFYVVSFKKLLILNVATLGIYTVYWFWKHWTLWRQAIGSNVWPIPRAIFNIFFVHSLFRQINEKAEEVTSQAMPSLHMPATVFVISQITYQIIDRVLPEDVNLLLTVPLLIAFLGLEIWCLWQAQMQANFACHDEEGQSNNNFGVGAYIVIALGVLLWVLIILGSLFGMLGMA